MDKTDKQIIDVLNSWKGTKWIHGQSLKGVGTDCIQFVISAAKELEWLPSDYQSIKYNKDWALHNEISVLEQEIAKFAIKVSSPFQVGDVLLFIYGKCASHAGFYIGNNMMIHAYQRGGIVRSSVRHYMNRFHSAWRVKENG